MPDRDMRAAQEGIDATRCVHTGQPSCSLGSPYLCKLEEPLSFRFHHCNVCCSPTDKGSSRSYNVLLFSPRSILDCRDRTRLGPVTHLLDLIFKRTDQKHRISPLTSHTLARKDSSNLVSV